jgi:predicted phage tail protein
MKSIQLYGELGEKFGKSFKLDISNPSEAIRALDVNLRGFREYLLKDLKGYQVFVGKKSIDELQLTDPLGAQVFKIVPVISGSKSSTFKIILGAVLIWAAWPAMGAIAPGSAAEFAAFEAVSFEAISVSGISGWGMPFAGGLGMGVTNGMIAKLGVSMMLGGISQALAPQPKPRGEYQYADNLPSYHFDGPINTSRQGVPVPICYGRLTIGSAVISAGVYSEDYVP